MNTLKLVALVCLCGTIWSQVLATNNLDLENVETNPQVHVRNKRTLLLKKKLIGAGLLGFGLGVAKGYKVGYKHSPEVHHVYVAPPPPPPVRYVEYIEKPVFVEKIVERPVIKHEEYHDGPWSPISHEPSPVYGPSW